MRNQGNTRASTAMVLLFALGSGCAAASEPVSSVEGNRDSGIQNAPLDAGACAPQVCTCGTLFGLRQCESTGQLGACQCTPPSTALPDAAVGRSVTCPAGRYAGNFVGAAGFVFETTDIEGFDFFSDGPPLEITITPPSGGSEFVALGDGVMRGNASGAFPFMATIKGSLNCETGQFKATLVGSVGLFVEEIRNDFTGTMESTYDTDAGAFTAGKWTVMGSEADGGTDFGLTGSGTWHAEHAKEGDAGT